MNEISRRDLLRTLFGALGVSSAVVLARAVVAAESEVTPAQGEVTQRADRLTESLPAGDAGREPIAFLNRAFRNGGGIGGGFRNGGFVNGGFRNGGFVNGGFRNGGFVNGGFRNGAFRNW